MMQSAIKIEKGVPRPQGRTTRTYPFEQMNVGDSFLLPEGGSLTARAGLYTIAKRHGQKIAVRKTDDGVRVWRVA